MTLHRRAALAALLGLGGCGLASGLSTRPYVERRDWPLLVRRPVDLPPRPRGRTLLIRTVQAGPGAVARGVQTLQPDGSVQTAFYEEWAAPPAEAFDAALRQWLAGSGLFAAVLDPGSRASPDMVLEARLEALIAEPSRGVARAAVSYVLLRQRGFSTAVLHQGAPVAEAALHGDAATEEVRALREAVATLCADVEAQLAPYARG